MRSETALLTKYLRRAPAPGRSCFFLQLAGTAERRDLGSWGTITAGLVDCDEPCRVTGRNAVAVKRHEAGMLLKIALFQGVFYLAAGLWPIVHSQSFQLVTGPKTDLWLVNTVGVLVTVVGAVLISASRRHRITDEIILLGVGSALGLATIDLVYALSGRISAVYLGDAAVEIGLAILWVVARLRQ
jgi:hypothetical protein